MSLHEQSIGATDEWYTPAYVFEAMGCVFDLDVASPGPEIVPWIPSVAWFTARGLQNEWWGYVWMNAPFGGRNSLAPWLDRFIGHGNGIALVPDRTSAPWWQQAAPRMDAILFVSPKIRFIGKDGLPGRSPAQGTALFGLGGRALFALLSAARNGLGLVVFPCRETRNAPLDGGRSLE